MKSLGNDVKMSWNSDLSHVYEESESPIKAKNGIPKVVVSQEEFRVSGGGRRRGSQETRLSERSPYTYFLPCAYEKGEGRKSEKFRRPGFLGGGGVPGNGILGITDGLPGGLQ